MKRHLVVAFVICGALGMAYFATRESDVRVGMRDLKLPSIERQNISKIEYSGKEKFALQKRDGRFVVEFSANGISRSVPASEEVVNELFVALAGIKGGTYVAEQVAKHEAFKVADDSGQKVTLYAAEKPVWSVIIGDYAEDGGRFVRLPGSNEVFLVKARFWDITRSGPTDFRERKIVALDENAISAVKVQKNEKQIVGLVRNDKNDFAFDEKTSALFPNVKPNPARSLDFVKAVARLRAAAFVEQQDQAAKAKALLAASNERIVITPKNQASSLVVRVANDTKEKKAYAQIEGANAIFEISDYAYSRLFLNAEELAEAVKPSQNRESAAESTDTKSLPPELQKQIQEAIRKQQGKS